MQTIDVLTFKKDWKDSIFRAIRRFMTGNKAINEHVTSLDNESEHPIMVIRDPPAQLRACHVCVCVCERERERGRSDNLSGWTVNINMTNAKLHREKRGRHTHTHREGISTTWSRPWATEPPWRTRKQPPWANWWSHHTALELCFERFLPHPPSTTCPSSSSPPALHL